MKGYRRYLVLATCSFAVVFTVWLWPHVPKEQPVKQQGPSATVKKNQSVVLPASSPAKILADEVDPGSAKELLSVIQSLPPVLTKSEQKVLLGVLRSGLTNMKNLTSGERFHIGNDLMLALRTRRQEGVALAETLSELSTNGSIEPVLRDYAIQHLGSMLMQDRAGGYDHTVIDALFKAAENTRWSTCGTALLALMHSKSKNTSHFPDDKFVRVSEAVILDPRADPAAVTSAIQVRMSEAKAIQVSERLRIRLREMVASAAYAPNVRVSAIAALGVCGEPSDVEVIKGLLGNDRLASASKAALDQLTRRHRIAAASH